MAPLRCDPEPRAAASTQNLDPEPPPLAGGFVLSTVLFSHPAGAWSFSVSELAAPGVEVGRLTAADPDLGDNAQLEFTILDGEEAEIFNLTGRDKEAVIVLSKVSDEPVGSAVPPGSQQNRRETL